MSPSVGDTPLTFEAAFAADNANVTPPVTDPSTSDVSTDQPPASAITQPVDTQVPEAGSTVTGSIPTARHEAILNGKRAEWEAERQRLAWADDLTRTTGANADQIREAWAIRQALAQDPGAVLGRLFAEAKNNPAIAEMVRQWTATAQAQPATTEDEPQPDRIDPTTGDRFYTAAQTQKWWKWNQAQIDAKYRPLLDEKQQREQREAKDAQFKADVEDRKKAVIAQWTELKKQPLFTQHAKDVEAYILEKGYKIWPNEAWLHILHTKVLPSLPQEEHAKAVASLQTQAAASSARPNAATPSTTVRPTRFDDPSLKW